MIIEKAAMTWRVLKVYQAEESEPSMLMLTRKEKKRGPKRKL